MLKSLAMFCFKCRPNLALFSTLYLLISDLPHSQMTNRATLFKKQVLNELRQQTSVTFLTFRLRIFLVSSIN